MTTTTTKSIILATVVIVISVMPSFGKAEDGQISKKTQEAIYVMQSLCLARSNITIEAKGSGGVLILKKGAQVEGEYKQTEITSLLDKLQNEVNLMGESDKVRKCMEPYITKILDSILSDGGSNGSSSKVNAYRNNGTSLNHPFYEDEGIRIEVLALESFGVYLNLRLKYTNKIPQTVLKIRSIPDRNGGELETYLIDNINNQYLAVNPYAVGRGQEPDMHSGVDLIPGIPKIFSFQYKVTNKPIGDNFIFSSNYLYCLGDFCFPMNRLSISIQGITLS